MRNIQQLLKGDLKEWYETHQNTAALLLAVTASLDVGLSRLWKDWPELLHDAADSG